MSGTIYKLFGEAAGRYDLHTPPRHYQHDHGFVLEELAPLPPGARILDVGCGTGVFIERARRAGVDARGIDISPTMISVAEARLGRGVVRVEPMQELAADDLYHAIVCLSWSFHYCRSTTEAQEVLARFFRALLPGGMMIMQAAHAANATGRLLEDREAGPNGEPDAVQFLYRFTAVPDAEAQLLAQYVYACRDLDELVAEEHTLFAADAHLVADLAGRVGFEEVRIYENWRREPFSASVSPFVVAVRPGR